MLGLKIAVTGALVMIVSGISIKAVGEWPGAAKGLPLLIAWSVGCAAMLVGLLMAIWS